MDISFDYYKVFYEVARCQNITQAAFESLPHAANRNKNTFII